MSEDYFRLELERIFRRCWLVVGRVEQIPTVGSFFVHEVPALASSILVTRAASGAVRAFHNTCTHRGNRLVAECVGRRTRFVCGYHGWTFDADGALRAVPDEAQFRRLDKAALGLRPVAVEVWNGFVHVNLATAPAESLPAALGSMAVLLDDYPFASLERVATYSCSVRANWKVCMDIGAEAYHVRFVHRASAPDSHVSDANPLAHLLGVWLRGRHRSTSLAANPAHELRPAEALVARHAPTVVQAGGAGALPSCLNPARVSSWGFDTHVLFPNFGLLLAGQWYVTHAYWPVSVRETRWETTLYTLPPATAGERLSQEYSAVFTRDLIREDWAQVERVQSGLESRAIAHIQLSDQEVMVRHAAKVVDDVVRGRDLL